MALNAYQVSYNGLTMGDGTAYDITQLTGFDALPTINQNDIDKLRDWGQYQGSYFATGRELVLSIEITDTSDAAFRADIDALNLAVVPQSQVELPFAVNLPGWAQASRQSNVRVIDRQIILDYGYTRHYATCDITFWATDPRIYDSTTQTTIITPPAVNAGVAWPIVWPVAWGSVATGYASASINNAGTFATRPVLTLTGAITSPTFTNVTTGQFMTFNGLTMQATDVLVIDFRAHTAILNGLANMRGLLTASSSWWELAPGNTTVAVSSTTVGAATTLTVAWQSAWM